MRDRNRIGLWLALAGGLLLASLAAPAAAVNHAALGDSYSSGEGTFAYDWGTDRIFRNRCHRGPFAWPRIAIPEAAPRVSHLACSGARIEHLYAGQTRAAPDDEGQIARLARLTQAGTVLGAISVTIGGNDPPINFAARIRACRAPAILAGDCLAAHPAPAEFAALRARLTQAYRDIHRAGGGGHMVVVGYPDIFPDPGVAAVRCGWLSPTEQERIERLAGDLDRTIAAAVHTLAPPGEPGPAILHVPIRDVLRGHELCTADSWVNPITPAAAAIFDPEQAHPTRRGQRAIAEAVGHALYRR